MKILKIILLLVSLPISSQQIKPLETDRPDQTETPSIVLKGMFQMESGFSCQKNDAETKSLVLPSSLWKYGVNDNFELRLITEISIEDNFEGKNFGLKPISVGCKIKISEEKGFWPKTSFIGHISVPNFASNKFKSEYFAPEFRFTMQHSLSSKSYLGYNLGAEWDGFSPQPTFIYTLVTGCTITNNLGAYVEVFGFSPQNEGAYHSCAGGFTYLFSNNFMIDLSGGKGISKTAPLYYYALGISFRI